MWLLTRSSSQKTDTHPWKPLHRPCSQSPPRGTEHGYGVNRWRLCESNDPETPPAIYRRLLLLFPGKKWLLYRADSYPSRSASILWVKVGDPIAPTTSPAIPLTEQ